jgi:LPXTG-site transpeptidase (sortase) family protein
MKKPYAAARSHRRFNDGLSVVVALVALYILLSPLMPHLMLWWAQRTDDTDGYVYQTQLVETASDNTKPIPNDNRLVLPTIQLDEEVHEGDSHTTLRKGLWRRPHTSTPDQGGNTVIVGHRFTYNDPSVFYHLDRIELGDRFPLYWQETEYTYEVINITVVSPLAVEIEGPTDQPMLTLYTCTPVWSAAQRLVIQARLIEDII